MGERGKHSNSSFYRVGNDKKPSSSFWITTVKEVNSGKGAGCTGFPDIHQLYITFKFNVNLKCFHFETWNRTIGTQFKWPDLESWLEGCMAARHKSQLTTVGPARATWWWTRVISFCPTLTLFKPICVQVQHNRGFVENVVDPTLPKIFILPKLLK